MIISEESHQNLSETILTLFAPCEGIVNFSHTLLVTKNVKLIGELIQFVKNQILLAFSKNILQLNNLNNVYAI